MVRRSSFLLLASCLSTIALPVVSFAQDALPASVQADLLQNQIGDAVKAGDFDKALSDFDRYRALGVPLAPSMLYLEARASIAANDLLRAKRVFEQYFTGGGQSDPNYKDALGLYSSILPAVRPIEEQAKAKAEAAATQMKADAEAAKAAELASYQARATCDGCPTMVAIPAGTFQFAQSHTVTFAKPFLLGRTEVTFAEWDACVAAKGCKRKSDEGWGRETRPVIDVSWEDARQYIAWLNKTTGKAFRLPSSAEWEYAARAGSTGPYSWGNEVGTNRANCNGCGSTWDNKQTAPVGSFAPNAWGLHDMHGNVREWLQDCTPFEGFVPPADGHALKECPPTPRGTLHQLRGGSWAEPSEASQFGRDVIIEDEVGWMFGSKKGYGLRLAMTLD